MMPARTIRARDLAGEGFRSDRSFGVLDYSPGHCRLLVRSPKDRSPQATNLDLFFWGVGYMALPTLFFRGVEIVEATPEELASLGALLHRPILGGEVVVLRSGTSRFTVVAPGVVVSENDWDPFETPIESHPRFRYECEPGWPRLADLLVHLQRGGTFEGCLQTRGSREGTAFREVS